MNDTLYHAFTLAAGRNPGSCALMVKRQGKYRSVTYGELSEMVNAVAENLTAMGLTKGNAIAILSANRPEWVITDLAALKLGLVVVPIYPTSAPGAVKYMLEDSHAQLLIVEHTGLYRTLKGTFDSLANPVALIIMEEDKTEDPAAPQPFSRLLETQIPSAAAAETVTAEDVATIVYTSGTTGEPKGVMLTHGNILSNVRAMIDRYQITAADTFLSYLPLCHMFERTCGYYAILFSGGVIAYAENVNTLAADVLEVRPTVLLAVPRVIEKAFEHAVQEVGQNSPWRRWLVTRTITSLNERADLRYRGQRVPFGLKARCLVLDKTVAARFRKIGGGKLRIVASGGAPLDRKIAKAYYVLGYNLVEGYGMTEASPVICSSAVADNTLGTVGKPVAGVEVRIGDNDEVIAKGPNVMCGYLNKPDETATTIDPDGWLHTGDQGRFDAKGNLIITGRIKDLIVTSYGKKIPASAIEAKILRSPYISQAMIYGDRRKFLVALIVPLRSALLQYAADAGIPVQDYEELLRDERIRRLIEAEIEREMSDCAPYEKVKTFRLLAEEFSQTNGLLTPLLKVRRKLVVERYGDIIESLYETADVARG